MPTTNNKRMKRIRNLIIICTLTAMVLSVSTYAWFVGMRTVNVSSFDVEIAVTDSLALSLDGANWSETITISKDLLDQVSYVGHSNKWGGDGLIPMSTVGDMDATASRLKLYEKASFTTTPGGYRLLASRVKNDEVGQPEEDGYVVFDLFIRNYTGAHYIEELNPKDEEAIYLTTDSAVTVALDGGVAGTGIENSVRVAFAQVGRIIGTTPAGDAAKITGITCTSNAEHKTTGICRKAQIWEPNDTAHVQAAINWYTTSCRPRSGEDVTKDASYNLEETCNGVVDGMAYPTYAVSDVITSTDNVDIYDGEEYNGYENTTLLVPFPYFTDTMKMRTGINRPTFMTLAPNSITKVRVYIFIEGQDIDNYDFASIGKKISVKFGFTKERFTPDDINYQGPPLNPEEI